jgi:hypothetical protein
LHILVQPNWSTIVGMARYSDRPNVARDIVQEDALILLHPANHHMEFSGMTALRKCRVAIISTRTLSVALARVAKYSRLDRPPRSFG